jgi:hypothetical protein
LCSFLGYANIERPFNIEKFFEIFSLKNLVLHNLPNFGEAFMNFANVNFANYVSPDGFYKNG